jgi:hypothetical protein
MYPPIMLRALRGLVLVRGAAGPCQVISPFREGLFLGIGCPAAANPRGTLLAGEAVFYSVGDVSGDRLDLTCVCELAEC